MNWIVAGSLVLATVVAGAAPAKVPAKASAKASEASPASWPARRKLPVATWEPAAIELFVEGLIADRDGDLGLALKRYDKANDREPQANTHYNLADLHRRLGSYRRALEAYRSYLELAPDAPDRAEVERLIARIETTPGTVVIDGQDLDAVVYVDGKLVGPSPVVVQLPDGRHAVDRIGPTTHRQRTVTTSGASHEHVSLNVEIDTPGNVVLSASAALGTQGSWVDKATGVTYSLPGRQQLAPGRHVTTPWGNRTCSKVVFDVPRGEGVTFVYLDAGPREKGASCHPVTVRQQKVRFPS